MDLISREIVKEQAKASYHVAESMEQLGNLYEDCIDAIPSAFKGMTYGEVMKAVLGIKDEQIAYGEYVNVIRLKRDPDSFMSFDSKVWDSPYKGVSK